MVLGLSEPAAHPWPRQSREASNSTKGGLEPLFFKRKNTIRQVKFSQATRRVTLSMTGQCCDDISVHETEDTKQKPAGLGLQP